MKSSRYNRLSYVTIEQVREMMGLADTCYGAEIKRANAGCVTRLSATEQGSLERGAAHRVRYMALLSALKSLPAGARLEVLGLMAFGRDRNAERAQFPDFVDAAFERGDDDGLPAYLAQKVLLGLYLRDGLGKLGPMPLASGVEKN